MSATNIVVLKRQLLPDPPTKTPLDVKSGDKVIGQLLINDSIPWAQWLKQVAVLSTEYIVSATVDWGVIPANSARTESISLLPFNVASPTDTFIVPINPPTLFGLPIGARMVLSHSLIAIIYNQTTGPVSLGPVNLQFLLFQRR